MITLKTVAPTQYPGETATQGVNQALFQDGDGPWQAMTGADGTYTARVAGPGYGVATLCSYPVGMSGVQRGIDVHHHVVAETTMVTALGCPREGTVEVTGQASGLVGAESSTLWTASAGSVYVAGVTDRYDFLLPAGRTELTSVAVSPDPRVAPPVARTGLVDLTGNATLNVDFSEGHTLERTPVPTPAEPGLGTVSAGVLTPRGLLYLYRTRSRDGAMVIATLPLALRRPDDHRRVALRWQEASEAAAVRTYLTIAIGDGPFDLTIGAPWDAPAAALQIQPYLRTVHPVMVSGAEPATVRLGASGSSPDGLTAIAWSVELSPAWLTGTGASSYTLPDLSRAPGWSTDFEFPARGEVRWETMRVEPGSTPELTRTAGRTGSVGEYCGDGIVNGPEACDTAGDSATCDRDCTLVVCGDDYVNTTAEQCDPPLKAYCTTSCQLENP